MENVQLTIGDMASLKALLEAAVNRGAFRANELTTVGAVYDKLAQFVGAATGQLAEQQQPEQGDTDA